MCPRSTSSQVWSLSSVSPKPLFTLLVVAPSLSALHPLFLLHGQRATGTAPSQRELYDLESTLHLNLAAGLLKEKSFARSIEHCERVLQNDPTNEKAFLRMAKAHLELQVRPLLLREAYRSFLLFFLLAVISPSAGYALISSFPSYPFIHTPI